MKSTNHNKIKKELLSFFDEEKAVELSLRFEDENYAFPFDESKDLDLLWALAIYWSDLSSNYFFHF